MDVLDPRHHTRIPASPISSPDSPYRRPPPPTTHLKPQLVNDNNQVGPGHDFLVRPFVCKFDHCDRAFARKSDLARHFRIHTNERPFICTFRGCGKAFIQRSALTVHTRVHTGERPHHCETCNKAFADSSSLARHRRIHTGKRPYGCKVPGCGRQFARRNTYLKHFKRQHPDLPPPTSSSVRALHIPPFRNGPQPFLTAGGSAVNSGSDNPEYGTPPSGSGHPHSFAASHPPEGAAYAYNGGYVNGQLHSSQLAASANNVRPYFHQGHSEGQGQGGPGLSHPGGPDSNQGGQAGQGSIPYGDPSSQNGNLGIGGQEYGNDQSVFSYQDNPIPRGPGGAVMSNGNVPFYFKQEPGMRPFPSEAQHVGMLPQGPWGGVGGGFAPGQLTLPPMPSQLPLQPSYYQNLQTMGGPAVKVEPGKASGQRVGQSPHSERAASPDLVDMNNGVPSMKFPNSANYAMPFPSVDAHGHMSSPLTAASMSALPSSQGAPGPPPAMQRYHSAPGGTVPTVNHSWNNNIDSFKGGAPYGDNRPPIRRVASATTGHKWENEEHNAHGSMSDGEAEGSRNKDNTPNNGTTVPPKAIGGEWGMPPNNYANVHGARPNQFRFSPSGSNASSASSLLNVTQTPQSLPPISIFPGGGNGVNQSQVNGYYSPHQTIGNGWASVPSKEQPMLSTPNMINRAPMFAPSHPDNEAHDQSSITLPTPPKPHAPAMRDRQASGVSAVGLGIANVNFHDREGSAEDEKAWSPSDDGSFEGEDEVDSDDSDGAGDDDSDDDFVLGAKPKRKTSTGKKGSKGRNGSRVISRPAPKAGARRVAA